MTIAPSQDEYDRAVGAAIFELASLAGVDTDREPFATLSRAAYVWEMQATRHEREEQRQEAERRRDAELQANEMNRRRADVAEHQRQYVLAHPHERPRW